MQIEIDFDIERKSVEGAQTPLIDIARLMRYQCLSTQIKDIERSVLLPTTFLSHSDPMKKHCSTLKQKIRFFFKHGFVDFAQSMAILAIPALTAPEPAGSSGSELISQYKYEVFENGLFSYYIN